MDGIVGSDGTHPAAALSRRGFLRSSAALACAAAGAGAIGPARTGHARIPFTYFGYVPIRRGPLDPSAHWPTPGGTWSRINMIPGEGGNSLLIAGDGGYVLIDTKNPPYGELLKDHTRYLKAGPAATPRSLVINTHHHADHTGGNHAFVGVCPVLAHVKAIERIGGQLENYQNRAAAVFRSIDAVDTPKRRFLDAHVAPLKAAAAEWTAATFTPARAWAPAEGDNTESIVHAGVKLEIAHYGPGHTDGDLVVYLTEHNVVHTGDLLFHESYPFVDRAAGATTDGWIAAIERVLERCDDETIVVPGHGSLTDRAGLRAQVEFFRVVRAAIDKAVRNGATREDVTAMTIEPYGSLALERIRPLCYGAIFDELTEQPPAKPEGGR